MKGKFGKIASICLALVLALGTMGVGLAWWSDTLYIEGTVNTGELDWELTVFSILDNELTTQPDYHCNNGFADWTFWPDPHGKNVAWGEGELVDGADSDGDMSQLNLTLHNVYPSYFNSVSVNARNNGTIPLVIEKVVINTTEITTLPAPVVGLDLGGPAGVPDGLYDVEIYWGNNIGQQLEPGTGPLVLTFWFHCLEDAPEGTTLTFTIEIVAVQWNAP